ncbi:N-acyl-L-amino acid amidohydrolase [Raoultella ornithinolytica]|nr:N-acyl-L-amino acid amidohydrolase [Raoultella ornithinolytica]
MAVSPSSIAEAIRWRRDFHACPELGYQEQKTSRRVAELLTSFGLQVHSGLAGTGVVATLENGPGPVIGLRADMDALPITELGDVSYKSRNPGVMHACGHDGHTAMLLAAAAHLTQTRRFRGTVHFVFQPAEENLGGARKMVEEGLFERFPMDGIYALHNWPGLPLGHVAVNEGPMMASLDAFEITLTGKSCHAAMPESGADPIVAAAQLIMALQTIPSRRLSPQESAVVSITQINGGEAINVLPDKVVLRGTFRCLSNRVRERVKGADCALCQYAAAGLRRAGEHCLVSRLSGDQKPSRGGAKGARGGGGGTGRGGGERADRAVDGVGGFCLHAGGLPWRLFLDRYRWRNAVETAA